jgi:hypothetical protein
VRLDLDVVLRVIAGALDRVVGAGRRRGESYGGERD